MNIHSWWHHHMQNIMKENLNKNRISHQSRNISTWHALLVARHRHKHIVDVIRTNGFVNIVMWSMWLRLQMEIAVIIVVKMKEMREKIKKPEIMNQKTSPQPTYSNNLIILLSLFEYNYCEWISIMVCSSYY